MLRPVSLQRINNILALLLAGSIILYFGKQFFTLILFAGLLAMLMTPFSNKLEKKSLPRLLTATISVFLIAAAISGIIILLSSQILNFLNEIPAIIDEIQNVITIAGNWIMSRFNIDVGSQVENISDNTTGAVSNAAVFLKKVAEGSFAFTGGIIVVMVFIFLFLLHREKYENFVIMLFNHDKRERARRLIDEINRISEQYLAGRLFAVVLMAVIYIAGFWIIGLRNALLLGLIAALISFIPYVGSIIAGVLLILLSFIEGSASQVAGVIVVTTLANIIGHYFIEPYIVGGSVNISPLFTILMLILGGVFWGLAGIILFLPLLGILKITFESVEGWHHYAYLIGDQDDLSAHEKIWLKLKEIFSRPRKI